MRQRDARRTGQGKDSPGAHLAPAPSATTASCDPVRAMAWSDWASELRRSKDMQAPFDQVDAETLYEQMRPDQRTAIALEFVRCLRLAGDPAADRFMAEAEQAEAAPQGGVAEEQVVVT